MTWLEDYWLDAVGWGGSALLVFSLLQARLLRFRTLNLAACLVLVVFNTLIGVWPMVAMNIVLCAINLYWIQRLLRERHDQAVFEVVEVRPEDAYFRHVLRTHAADIRQFHPDADAHLEPAPAPGQHAFLVLRGDETVGVVVLRKDGEVAHVQLDYVTPRYRDFSPGEFVWRHSTVLRDLGIRRVVAPDMVGAYYGHVGFRRDGRQFVLDLQPHGQP